MLNHITSGVPPVVKDLRPQDMTANAPYWRVPLLGKPLVTQILGIKIMHLKRAMMDVARLVSAHEEGVMIYKIVTTINMRKERHVLPSVRGIYVEEVRRGEVEIARIKVDLFLEILHAQTEMPQLRSASVTFYSQICAL